jgi:hypothetical protein
MVVTEITSRRGETTMTKLAFALALTTALVPGFAPVSFAGEGSPDMAVPSSVQYYGGLTSAPVAMRDSAIQQAPRVDENARFDRATQKQGD